MASCHPASLSQPFAIGTWPHLAAAAGEPSNPAVFLFSPSVKIVNETLPALLALKAQGLVRHIGITGLPLKIFKYVLDRCGLLGPTTVQLC